MNREQATSWFDRLYTLADRDSRAIPWAHLVPGPFMVDWLDAHPDLSGSALVVGCGLGDDAEDLAKRGLDVTAFDVSSEAIAWCRRRFPESSVEYIVADLFDQPKAWSRAFDLVVELHTVQSLPLNLRDEALAAVADPVAPGGTLLVVAWGRPDGTKTEGPPWRVSREEVAFLARTGLNETGFDEMDDFLRVEYRRL